MLKNVFVSPAHALTLLLALLAFSLSGCASTGEGVEQGGTTSPSIGQAAPDFTLATVDGMRHSLSTYTDAGPVVLIVLRGYPGYQCPICSRQVGSFISHAQDFAQRSATVVLVYPGPSDGLVEHAQDFIAGKSLPANFLFLTDPDYQFTDAYGVRWSKGNETAYPSTFVIDQGSRNIRHAHISTNYRNRTTPQAMLSVLDGQALNDEKPSRPRRRY